MYEKLNQTNYYTPWKDCKYLTKSRVQIFDFNWSKSKNTEEVKTSANIWQNQKSSILDFNWSQSKNTEEVKTNGWQWWRTRGIPHKSPLWENRVFLAFHWQLQTTIQTEHEKKGNMLRSYLENGTQNRTSKGDLWEQ